MPRQAHYPSREQRVQRALVAAQHAATVQTASQVKAQTVALETLNETVGGDISAISETLATVNTTLEEVETRLAELEAAV